MIESLSKGSDTLGHTRRNIIEEKSIGDCRRSIFGHVTNRQSGIFAAYQGNENTEFPRVYKNNAFLRRIYHPAAMNKWPKCQ